MKKCWKLFQAFQTTKALRSGDVVAAGRIRNPKRHLKQNATAISFKNHFNGKTRKGMSWNKSFQCEEIRDTLSSYKPSVFFGNPVYMYWGTALSQEETVKTSPRTWPGKKIMGDIIARAAENLRKSNKQKKSSEKR